MSGKAVSLHQLFLSALFVSLAIACSNSSPEPAPAVEPAGSSAPQAEVENSSSPSVDPIEMAPGYQPSDDRAERNEPAVIKATNHIVGGEEADEGEWPFVVSLAYRSDKLYHYCGGSLIAPRWILTAAHCKPNTDDVVIIGRTNFLEPTGREFGIQQVISHPDYDSVTKANDIALIYLETEADNPELPLEAAGASSRAGEDAWAVGWGTTESGGELSIKLREVDVPISELSVCRDQYGDPAILDSMLCAGKPDKDSCQGDSGGPLMVSSGENSWIQVGIVSFGRGCGHSSYLGVYTKVAAYAGWINSEL